MYLSTISMHTNFPISMLLSLYPQNNILYTYHMYSYYLYIHTYGFYSSFYRFYLFFNDLICLWEVSLVIMNLIQLISCGTLVEVIFI